MPTPGGLPKAGEVWRRTYKLPVRDVGSSPRLRPKWETCTFDFVVLERGSGSYWSLRVFVPSQPPSRQRQSWVDPSYWFSQGELQYIGPAGPETRKKLGLS